VLEDVCDGKTWQKSDGTTCLLAGKLKRECETVRESWEDTKEREDINAGIYYFLGEFEGDKTYEKLNHHWEIGRKIKEKC
jgi:hypothetical protein